MRLRCRDCVANSQHSTKCRIRPSCSIPDRVIIRAERVGQLDPQSPVVQSVGVLIGGLPSIAGKLPCTFGGDMKSWLHRE